MTKKHYPPAPRWHGPPAPRRPEDTPWLLGALAYSVAQLITIDLPDDPEQAAAMQRLLATLEVAYGWANQAEPLSALDRLQFVYPPFDPAVHLPEAYRPEVIASV